MKSFDSLVLILVVRRSRILMDDRCRFRLSTRLRLEDELGDTEACSLLDSSHALCIFYHLPTYVCLFGAWTWSDTLGTIRIKSVCKFHILRLSLHFLGSTSMVMRSLAQTTSWSAPNFCCANPRIASMTLRASSSVSSFPAYRAEK